MKLPSDYFQGFNMGEGYVEAGFNVPGVYIRDGMLQVRDGRDVSN